MVQLYHAPAATRLAQFKPTRWDWWQIPLELALLVKDVPGVVSRSNGIFEIHRTHLPLLASLGVSVPLTPVCTAPSEVQGIQLRPWQPSAIAWAKPRRGTLIVAQPRLGKTACALAMHDPSSGPLFVVAPLDVRDVWCHWIRTMFGEEPTVLEGRTVDPKAHQGKFIFAHFDILLEQQSLAIRPGTFIVDEIHLLSNPRSRRARGAQFFASLSHRVIGLTGTPLWNKVTGLWPMMATVNPGAWGGSPFLFQQRYASPEITEHGWKYGDLSNAEEWHVRRSEVVFETNWQTVAPGLASTRFEFLKVPLSIVQVHALDDIVADIASDITGAAAQAAIGVIARYRKATGQLKRAQALEAILAEDTPVVVWTWHKELASTIARKCEDAGREAFVISGDESVSKRQASIARWRKSADGVLCATMAVGQVGIDLSHADRAIFVEIDWTPAVMYQAEMRTFSPDRPMRITYINIDHPVERMLMRTVTEKMDRAAQLSMPAAGNTFGSRADEDDDVVLDRLRKIFTPDE